MQPGALVIEEPTAGSTKTNVKYTAAILALLPEGEVVVRSLASGDYAVRSVSLLGADIELAFEQDAEGLRVTLPERTPESCALALKVVAEEPFGS